MKWLWFLLLLSCVKESTIEKAPICPCNITTCYITDETGALHVQVFRDCALDFKLVRNPQGETYWQITMDNPQRTTRRVNATHCEWEPEQ